MTEFDLLITAHELNDTLGLDLTPAQIARALEWHEHRTRPREGRTVYSDPTSAEALRNIATKKR